MIAPEKVAEGTEFVVTIVVSAVAGLLAFLFCWLVVNIHGLKASRTQRRACYPVLLLLPSAPACLLLPD